MSRHPFIAAIAVALAGYAIYVALYVPPLVVGGRVPVILGCFVVQACVALAAAVGVWRGSAWAPFMTVLLGISIATTQLVEALGLGIIAADRAIVIGAAALVVTVAAAMYVARTRGLTREVVS